MLNGTPKGHVVSVQGPVVDVRFTLPEDIPNVYSVIYTKTIDDKRVVLEVAEHREKGGVRCIAMNSTLNLQRHAPIYSDGTAIEIPSGEDLYARMINMFGEPIDQKGPIESKEKFPVRSFRADAAKVNLNPQGGKSFEVLETGIKMIDLLFPLVKGSKTGILGGAGLGKTLIVLEMIYQMIKKHQGTCVFAGVGERVREGNELYYELSEREILPRVAVVFGQMNEPPGARFGAALTGVTIAESIQRKNKNVLLFVDNIFRYVQAGAEISTLLGRIPSETGYQPTLISEVSEFHERIRSSREAGGSITSVEAVYVPADDLSDPAVVCIFSFLDSLLVLSRERIQLGLYPAIDPLLSSCANLDPDIVGQLHFDTAQQVLRMFQKYDELRRTVLVIGIDELSPADRIIYERARKLQNFFAQPFFIAEPYTGKKGEYVTVLETIEGCEKIMSGAVDHMSEQEFYMIGALTNKKPSTQGAQAKEEPPKPKVPASDLPEQKISLPDQRVYKRLETKINVVYRPIKLKEKSKGEFEAGELSTSLDISAGGVSFLARQSLMAGSLVEIKIELPDGQNPIECLAKVVRSQEVNNKNRKSYQVAVLFMNVSSGERSRLDKYVNHERGPA